MNNQLLKELSTTAKNEHELQSFCVQWFNMNYPNELLFAIPNGGLRNLKVAVKLKKEGVVSGIPDLFLAKGTTDYNGMFIEMKFKKGKKSDNQNKIHLKLIDNNYAVVTCWTYEGFIDIVTLYMNNVSINNNNNK